MASENKTKPTDLQPLEYLASLDDAKRREDGLTLLKLMQEVTHDKPVMWGPTMIGFGKYHYKYASGREGDSFRVGFSPRKATLVLYGLITYDEPIENGRLFKKLGKHTRSKACVYVKSLQDIDLGVLRQMIANGYAQGDYDATTHNNG